MSEARSRGFTGASVPDGYERFVRAQLFDPWARELLRRASLGRGARVLDVACGPGTVARLAAAQTGADGAVVACDISAEMLAVASAREPEPGAAPISYRECPAEALIADDESFELALCQQGLQFFPDRVGALGEMRRTLREGGKALVSTWAREHPLGLFGPIAETLRELGLREPYPRAFDPQSYTLSGQELSGLLQAAGFSEVRLETVELDCSWPSPQDVVGTVSATPFGSLVASLAAEQRERVRAELLSRLGDPVGEVTLRTVSHIASAVRRG
jgi:ubiquinone/menaquinone biosynthesis C-methylase UbiE